MADGAAAGFDTDVLVVGLGPAGATAALALATYGVGVIGITRHDWVSNSPRAHITNQRAMEVFRDLGVARDIDRYGSPWDHMGDTLFTTSFAGPEIARIRTWGTGDARHGDYVRASPEAMRDVPQPFLEAVVLEAAAARGAQVLLRTEYLGHEEDELGVTVLLRERRTGREYRVRARYLIGADGAGSRVLTAAGLGVEGRMGRASTAYVQFEADLSRYVAHRPSILYWVLDPSAGHGEIGMGLLRAVRQWDRWIAGWGYDPERGEPDFSRDAVVRQIRTLVGDPALEPTVVGTSTWQVNEAWAPVYGTARVLCAGDAVHRHPPSNGLGSNTCVQDAFNLAWKLAYAVRGDAGPALVGSYTDERAPVGAQIVARANRSRVEFGPVRAALRTAEGSTESMLALLRDPGERGVAARADLAAAIRGKDGEFNAHGVELNQRYRSRAVIEDPHQATDPIAVDEELFAIATTRPGAKLPHAWLVGTDGRRRSTLDLVGHGRFTVITGLSGTVWREAVDRIALPYLDCVVVGLRGAEDLYFEWAGIREIAEDGALLVRPDGYISWRSSLGVADVAAAAEVLATALDAVLDRGAVPR